MSDVSAVLDWLKKHAVSRGMHNYAQWIEEHAAAAIGSVESVFHEPSDEVARLQVQNAELTDQLSAERANSAQLEQQVATLTEAVANAKMAADVTMPNETPGPAAPEATEETDHG